MSSHERDARADGGIVTLVTCYVYKYVSYAQLFCNDECIKWPFASLSIQVNVIDMAFRRHMGMSSNRKRKLESVRSGDDDKVSQA